MAMVGIIDAGPVESTLAYLVCLELSEAVSVPHDLVQVTATWANELCAGCDCLSVGRLFAVVPCLKLRDVARGNRLDVVARNLRWLVVVMTIQVREWHMGLCPA